MQKSKIILGSFPTTTQRYYDFQQEELTRINGIEEREVQTALIYCTRYSIQEFFKVRWETFKNQYWSTRMSETDKILHKKLDLITSDLQIIISPQGTLHDLTNFNEVQMKAKLILDQLSKKYTDNTDFLEYRNLYTDKQRVLLTLNYYPAISLYLPLAHEQDLIVRNTQLIPNTIFYINETLQKNSTNIQINGSLHQTPDLDGLHKLFALKGIKISSEKALPCLEEYQGNYNLTSSGTVKDASFDIHFTFGKHYEKKINYQLKTIRHEEI